MSRMFTGREDLGGYRIYEGDILGFFWINRDRYIIPFPCQLVKFRDGEWEPWLYWEGITPIEWEYESWVIGNKYDDPWLLDILLYGDVRNDGKRCQSWRPG